MLRFLGIGHRDTIGGTQLCRDQVRRLLDQSGPNLIDRLPPTEPWSTHLLVVFRHRMQGKCATCIDLHRNSNAGTSVHMYRESGETL